MKTVTASDTDEQFFLKFMTWLTGVQTLVVIIVIILVCANNSQTNTPVVLPIPKLEELTCENGNGYYRPANGANYVVLNDERC